MWIVDASVWIDYFAGRATEETELLHGALGRRRIGLVDIVLCEVLQGFRHRHEFDAARGALLRFPVFPAGGRELAVRSAENYRFLRRHGSSVRSTIDCLIATFVIEHDLSLLHRDRDFDAFEEHLGLRVVRSA